MKHLLQKFLYAIVTLVIVTSCGSNGNKQSEKKIVKSINITVFLDLSNRLVNGGTPSQQEKDIDIVKDICAYFKEETKGIGILTSTNHLKVLFYPTPKSSKIATLAEELNVDMNVIPKAERMPTLNKLSDKFCGNLTQIYKQTISESNWIGCDIYDFFDSKKVDQLCINDNARNILIILTDGYIYATNNLITNKKEHKYNFIDSQTINDPKSSLITSRKGLNNIEVLIMEVNSPQPKSKKKVISLLENWLQGMGVKKYAVAETDLPINTRPILESFLK